MSFKMDSFYLLLKKKYIIFIVVLICHYKTKKDALTFYQLSQFNEMSAKEENS